jgi:hypothetical protein
MTTDNGHVTTLQGITFNGFLSQLKPPSILAGLAEQDDELMNSNKNRIIVKAMHEAPKKETKQQKL